MKNLILTVILLILSIKGIYACTGCFSANMAKSRDSVFHQELYSQGKISPEEAESWHIGIASDFDWDINYWNRFSNLKSIHICKPMTYIELKKILTNIQYADLVYIRIENYHGDVLPDEIFKFSSLRQLDLCKSFFQEFGTYQQWSSNLNEIYIFDSPYFNNIDLLLNNLPTLKHVIIEGGDVKNVSLKVADLHSFYLVDNISTPEVDNMTSALDIEIVLTWDYNKSGCLDTLPVVILEKTGSVLPEFRVKCIKNLPDNINYIKSISSAFKHIDVSNRKALPANTQYLVNVRSLTLLNPHRIRSLEPMYELKKLSGLTFYQNNGSLLPEDFERLLGEVVKLKQLNHLAFAGGFPDEITEKSMHYIQQLDFLSALRIPPEAQGKSSDIIRKYLPDNVKLR